MQTNSVNIYRRPVVIVSRVRTAEEIENRVNAGNLASSGPLRMSEATSLDAYAESASDDVHSAIIPGNPSRISSPSSREQRAAAFESSGRKAIAERRLVMVLVLGLFFCQFSRSWLIFVSVMVRLIGVVIVGSVRMRMSMFMLVRMDQIAVAMLMSVFMRMFVDVRHRFFVFHFNLLRVARQVAAA